MTLTSRKDSGYHMNILVLGASGRTGTWVIRAGLARSHAMTALVRSARGLRVTGANIVVGDPINSADISAALHNQQIVISCLGQRSAADSQLLHQAALATVEAMRSGSIERYIVLS